MLRFFPFVVVVLACSSAPTEEPSHNETADWPYETLSPAERAVVDRGRDVAAWRAVHKHFADAVRENARRAQQAAEEAR